MRPERRHKILFFAGLLGLVFVVNLIVPPHIYARLWFRWSGPEGVMQSVEGDDALVDKLAVIEADNRQLSKALLLTYLAAPSHVDWT